VLGDTIVVDVEDGEIVLKKGEPGKYKAPDISLSKREQEVFDQLDALITQRVDEEEEIEVDEIDEILNPRIKPALTPAGFDIKMSVDLNGFFPGETDAGLKSVIAPVFARVDKAKGKPLAKAVRTFIKRAAAIAKQSTSARLDDLVAKSPIPRSNPKIKSFDDIRKNYDTVEIREELVASLMMDLDSPPVPVQVSHGGEDSIDIQITDVNRLPAETASKLGRLFAMTPANTAESSRMGREEGFDSGLIEMLEALRVIRGLGGETNFWTEDGKTIIWLRIPAKESE